MVFLSGGALILMAQAGLVRSVSADQQADAAESISVEEREPETRQDPGKSKAVEVLETPSADEAWRPILYVPPSRGQARHTAAGGTRAVSSPHGRVAVAVLAPPDHVALTTRAQPTLYWYVSTETAQRIDITLVDDDEIDPLLELTVPSPVAEGVHALALTDHGLDLERGHTYRWHVAVIQDAWRRSTDTLAEGFIERTEVSSSLEAALKEASRSGAADAAFAPYATSGIWYDAMDEVLSAMGEDPENPYLQRQRAALLEQIELNEVVRSAARDGY
jgi:hypothetical protein